MVLDPGSTQEVSVDYTTLDLVSQLFALQGEHLAAISDYIGQHCMLTGDLGVPLRLLQPSYVDGRDNAIDGFAQGREVSAACGRLIADTMGDYAAIDAISHDASVSLGKLVGITVGPYSAPFVSAELQRGAPGAMPPEEGGNVVLDAYGNVVDAREWVDAGVTVMEQSPFNVYTESTAAPSILDRASIGHWSGTAIDSMVDRARQDSTGSSAAFEQRQNDRFESAFTRGQNSVERARTWTENTFGSGNGTPAPTPTGSGTGTPTAPPAGGSSGPAPSGTSTPGSGTPDPQAPTTPAPTARTTLGPESVWLDTDRTRVVSGTIGGLNAAWGLTDSVVGVVEAGQGLGAARADLDAMRDLADRPANTTSIDWARGGRGW